MMRPPLRCCAPRVTQSAHTAASWSNITSGYRRNIHTGSSSSSSSSGYHVGVCSISSFYHRRPGFDAWTMTLLATGSTMMGTILLWIDQPLPEKEQPPRHRRERDHWYPYNYGSHSKSDHSGGGRFSRVWSRPLHHPSSPQGPILLWQQLILSLSQPRPPISASSLVRHLNLGWNYQWWTLVVGKTFVPTTTRCESISPTTHSTAASNTDNKPPTKAISSSIRPPLRNVILGSRSTVRRMEEDSAKYRLQDRYLVDWAQPLGEGSFGAVYMGTDRQTGEKVAVKQISKRYTNSASLQAELQALLHIRDSGGHPNICSLRENFSEDGYYYLTLDLIAGGEMFDHLVEQGAFSEADAARLVREVASALAFLHGIGVTHCDLKPENLMLSSRSPTDTATNQMLADPSSRPAFDAVIKLIDFGSAKVHDLDLLHDDETEESSGSNENSQGNNDTTKSQSTGVVGNTLAYCPPEVLDASREAKVDPSIDMWALGVILYVMLTGIHPFDLSGQATDEEVAENVLNGKPPPLHNSAITAHLSDSAIDLIDKLMQRDPNRRITADQMLEHPWTKGETARQDIMVGSDKRLSLYRQYKSGIAEKVFQQIMNWSDEEDLDQVSRRTSLIERSFRSFDPQHKGYLTAEDLQHAVDDDNQSNAGERRDVQHESESPMPTKAATGTEDHEHDDSGRFSLSDFSDLLSENMVNRYFPRGTVVYREGEKGNAMYIINSGTISVESMGSVVKRHAGDFFGEGALFHPEQRRSATIRCDTPVHAMEISQEYFDKYLAKSNSKLLLMLREKDKIRKRNRTKMILRLQDNLHELSFANKEVIWKKGDEGDNLLLVESGRVVIYENENHVLTATPGNMCGEHSLLTGRQRNCTAVCEDPAGCVLKEMDGADFRAIVAKNPTVAETVRELCLRRDFKKAVVLRLKQDFPYHNPKEAFDAVKSHSAYDDRLDFQAVRSVMLELNSEYTDEDITEVMKALNLKKSGFIFFDEFERMFVADIRKSASV